MQLESTQSHHPLRARRQTSKLARETGHDVARGAGNTFRPDCFSVCLWEGVAPSPGLARTYAGPPRRGRFGATEASGGNDSVAGKQREPLFPGPDPTREAMIDAQADLRTRTR